MELKYQGKTKDVYALADGNYLLKFKDDVTGTDGVFDPGANTVGLSIEGMGKGGLRISEFFFKKISDAGIFTHYVDSDIQNQTMTVRPATPFGNGLEVICRYRAVGSFMRRYGQYASEGQALDAFVEITLKDDERNDPPISQEGLEMLGILQPGEYEMLRDMTKEICALIKAELFKKNLELYDIKLEFGRCDGKVALIDEVSGGNMRVYKDGEYVDPLNIVKIMLG